MKESKENIERGIREEEKGENKEKKRKIKGEEKKNVKFFSQILEKKTVEIKYRCSSEKTTIATKVQKV